VLYLDVYSDFYSVYIEIFIINIDEQLNERWRITIVPFISQ